MTDCFGQLASSANDLHRFKGNLFFNKFSHLTKRFYQKEDSFNHKIFTLPMLQNSKKNNG